MRLLSEFSSFVLYFVRSIKLCKFLRGEIFSFFYCIAVSYLTKQGFSVYMLCNIQLLRALAAIMVLFHHAYPHYQAMGGRSEWFVEFAKWGFVGVDVFFVISGFVICYTTMTKPRTVANALLFLKHRFLRVFLGYWPFFLALFSFYWAFMPQTLEPFNLWGSFFLYETNMFELLLPVTWSLTYELYFYSMFFVLLFFSSKWVLPFSIGMSAVVLVFSVLWYPTGNEALNLLFYPLLLEFFLGVLLYFVYEKLQRWAYALVALLIAMTLFALGVYQGDYNGLMRIYAFGLGAFCLVLGMILLEQTGGFKARGMWIKLGDSSFSLYLSHLLLLSFFYFSGLRDGLAAYGGFTAEMGFALYMVFIVFSSHLYYKLVELNVYKRACRVQFSALWQRIASPKD